MAIAAVISSLSTFSRYANVSACEWYDIRVDEWNPLFECRSMPFRHFLSPFNLSRLAHERRQKINENNNNSLALSEYYLSRLFFFSSLISLAFERDNNRTFTDTACACVYVWVYRHRRQLETLPRRYATLACCSHSCICMRSHSMEIINDHINNGDDGKVILWTA